MGLSQNSCEVLEIMKTISCLRFVLFNKIAIGSMLLGASLLISGCASTGHHEDRGTLAGAATGAVLGTIIGNQSGEPGEGAAVGAIAGALIGRELGRKRDQTDYGSRPPYDGPSSAPVYDATRVDYGALMTEDEKRRIRQRAGRDDIADFSDYLTPDEKRRLLDRADQGVGL